METKPNMTTEELTRRIGKLNKAIVAYEDNLPHLIAANETGTTTDDQATDDELNEDFLDGEAAPTLDQMRHQLAALEEELARRKSAS